MEDDWKNSKFEKMTKKQWRAHMLDALDTAKFNLVNNPDNFMPVAFMQTPERGLCVVAVQNADKYTATEVVCYMAYENKAHCVGTIMDSWYLSKEHFNAEDGQYDTAATWEELGTVPPSQHPDGKMALIMWGAAGVEQFMEMVPYHINSYGKVVFEKKTKDMTTFEGPNDGKLGGKVPEFYNELWNRTYRELMKKVGVNDPDFTE